MAPSGHVFRSEYRVEADRLERSRGVCVRQGWNHGDRRTRGRVGACVRVGFVLGTALAALASGTAAVAQLRGSVDAGAHAPTGLALRGRIEPASAGSVPPSTGLRGTARTPRKRPAGKPAAMATGTLPAMQARTGAALRPSVAAGVRDPSSRAAARTELRSTSGIEPPHDDGASGGLSQDIGGAVAATAHALPGLLPADGFRTSHRGTGAPVRLSERPVLRNALRWDVQRHAGDERARDGGSASAGDTVALALRGSHSAEARFHRAHADRARVHSALGAFLPKVTGVVQVATDDDGGRGRLGENHSATAGVEVSMPLFTSGANTAVYRQAKAAARTADLAYLAEEQRVAMEALTAHVNLRLNRRVERTLSRNVEAMGRIEVIARRLFRAGDASRTDIALAQANVESARTELDLARRAREEVEADYASLTGNRAPAKLGLPAVRELLPASLGEARERALRHNPSLAAADSRADAQDHAARAETARFGARVDLSGGYTHDLDDAYGDRLDTGSDSGWSLGVRVRVPLFDATAAPSVLAARHEALEQRHRADDEARQLTRSLARAWATWRSASRRVGIAERQVAAVSRSLEGARREYAAGYRSITDVLGDQVKLARARITLEEARHQAALAACDILITIGEPRTVARLVSP